MGEYIFEKEGIVAIYSNLNDTSLQTDKGAKQAFKDLAFLELEGAQTKEWICKANIVILHGGSTANQIVTGKTLKSQWCDKTIFVVFSSQGRQGLRPSKIRGDERSEHLAVFMQQAPNGEEFGRDGWKRIIEWSLSARNALIRKSVSEIIAWYNENNGWIGELVPQRYPEFLVAAYLIRLARDSQLDVKDEELPDNLWKEAGREYSILSGQDGESVDIETLEISKIRSVLANAESTT